MSSLFTGLAALLAGGGAAAGGSGIITTLGPATGTGLSLSSVLQGAATVGGLVASIAAGAAEADSLEAQAIDAEAEKGFETVQSADRKRQVLAAAAEAAGETDVAYAGSGVDLSVGSAVQARKSVYREADLSLTTNASTTAMRLDRLTQRAENLRRRAKQARFSGIIGGLTGAARGAASILDQV